MNLHFNPQKLLTEAGAGWVWDVTFTIILTGLVISFVAEIFKIQKKGDPDFAGLVWKTCIILILYKFLPGAVEDITEQLNRSLDPVDLDAAFFKAFSAAYSNLNLSSGTEALPEGCPANQNITLINAGVDYLSSYFTQYIQKLMLFFLIMGIWTFKEIVFSWAWPVFMSVSMLGMCSALVIPSFPGQGFASLGGFFRSLASVSLWPVVYSAMIFICKRPLKEVFDITNELLKCPMFLTSDTSFVTAVAGLSFLLLAIILTPFLSARVISNEGVKGAVSAGLSGAAAALTISGKGISRSAGQAGFITGIGTQLIKSGEMVSRLVAVENTNKYSYLNVAKAAGEDNTKQKEQADFNTSRELITNDKDLKK